MNTAKIILIRGKSSVAKKMAKLPILSRKPPAEHLSPSPTIHRQPGAQGGSMISVGASTARTAQPPGVARRIDAPEHLASSGDRGRTKPNTKETMKMKWINVVCFFWRLFAKRCPVCRVKPQMIERFSPPVGSVYVICDYCRLRCHGDHPSHAVERWNDMIREWEPTK